MASYQEHLSQANKNIRILERVNKTVPDSLDWQVTMVFYAALHFANAHIARTINQHYRTHAKVSEALNPHVSANPSAFDNDTYLAYLALQALSRRSRYLCSEEVDASDPDGAIAHPVKEKHLAKAIRHLNTIIYFFSNTYGVHFTPIELLCEKIKQDKLKYFTHKLEKAGAAR